MKENARRANSSLHRNHCTDQFRRFIPDSVRFTTKPPLQFPFTNLHSSTTFSMKNILILILSLLFMAGRAPGQNDVQCFSLNHPATVDVDCAGTTGAVATWTVTATPL